MSTAQEKTIAREAAHQAVKCFDIKPDLASTVEAIEALQEYERTLRAGDTVSVDERFAFEQRWDARVAEGRAQ